jgi:hypothetical protein
VVPLTLGLHEQVVRHQDIDGADWPKVANREGCPAHEDDLCPVNQVGKRPEIEQQLFEEMTDEVGKHCLTSGMPS